MSRLSAIVLVPRASPLPLDYLFYNEDKSEASSRSLSMTTFWQEHLSDASGSGSESSRDPLPSEGEALDAFSRVVVNVAETIRPTVVNLRAGRGRGEGSGSGVLFTPDGFLLTNAHVVGGHERVRLRLNDGREVTGRVVGSDPWTDLAIVQAEASG